MERRNFLKQNLMASGALLSTSAFANTKMSPIEESTFKLNYGFHDGMFKSHAGNDFIEQIKFAHSMGFRSIEDNGMMGRTPAMQEKIGNTLASLGMTMGVFVISFDNWPLSVSMTSGNKDWRKIIFRIFEGFVFVEFAAIINPYNKSNFVIHLILGI